MALWKDGSFIANAWRLVREGNPIPPNVSAFVTPERWRAEREDLRARSAPVGLWLSPGADWSDLGNDLGFFPVIAVQFPKFADGRAFSIARLLRERDGYTGEIRAVGDYIIDQVPLMRRVGIDAFDADNPILKRALENGEWPEVPSYLQPAFAAGERPAGGRPWARQR